MKNLNKMILMPKLLLAVFVLSGLVVFAAGSKTVSRALNIARPDVKVEISGSVERAEKAVSLEKGAAVNAGEVIDWKIASVNEGAGDAQNYRVVGQIPAGTSFVAGSAQGDAAPKATFSIDGGKTFSAKPLIEEKQADGSVAKVAAPVSAYTQVMFQWEKPLAAQAGFNAAYQVRVK